MSTRRAKQLIYGVLYGILWIGFFGAVYAVFLRPALPASTKCTPSSSSTECASQNAAHLKIQGDVHVFRTSDGHYTFLAEVVNPNPDLAARSFDYSFDLDDASGTPKVSFSGNSFIYGSQVRYVIAANEAASGDFDHAAIRITNVEWVPVSELGVVPQLTFGNVAARQNAGSVSVEGDVTNRDVSTLESIEIIAVFMNPDGTPAGASATAVDPLAADGVAHFSVIYPAIAGIDPARNELFAYASRR